MCKVLISFKEVTLQQQTFHVNKYKYSILMKFIVWIINDIHMEFNDIHWAGYLHMTRRLRGRKREGQFRIILVITACILIVELSLMQLYVRRSKYIRTSSEKANWSSLDNCFMTDESSDEETLLVHKITWRTRGMFQGYVKSILLSCVVLSFKLLELNELTEELDRRHVETSQHSRLHHPTPKRRILSTPSSRIPPPNSPSWAVVSDL